MWYTAENEMFICLVLCMSSDAFIGQYAIIMIPQNKQLQHNENDSVIEKKVRFCTFTYNNLNNIKVDTFIRDWPQRSNVERHPLLRAAECVCECVCFYH